MIILFQSIVHSETVIPLVSFFNTIKFLDSFLDKFSLHSFSQGKIVSFSTFLTSPSNKQRHYKLYLDLAKSFLRLNHILDLLKNDSN